MLIKNTTRTFGLVSIFLHWVMALVIMGLFAVGLWMVELTYYDPWYRTAPDLHKSVGVLLFLAFLLRIAWHSINPKPMPLTTYTTFESVAAKLVHGVLYLFILLVIISGYFISTADGRGIEVFDWFTVPAWVTGIENQEDIAGDIHFYLACSLIGFASGHGLAALKHHFVDKDETLKRMLNPNE